MELRLLKVFSAIAESGSLVTAANKLHLTPSAMSHSLRALETHLGCRLFERVGKRMVLNQAGDQLLLAIRQPLRALETAADDVKQLGKWGQSRLRLGADAAACQFILPGVIRDLKKSNPSLELQISSGDTDHLLDLLRGAKIDVALCLEPESSTGFDVRFVFRDELLLVYSPEHPWSAGRPITHAQLSEQAFIGFPRSTLTARMLADYLKGMQVSPRWITEADDIGMIVEFVKLNLGVAALAPWTISHELVRGRLMARPMGPKPLKREWAIVSLAVRPKTYLEESFCRLCRTHTAGIRLDRKDLQGVNEAAIVDDVRVLQ
ncbi:MAG TPA: LysR family transcriptional regulator [Verrucomicrobiae bacterium]|nr:LysR family transcriptional regulator [Verrucomicrobiae bacterium]